jgi:hypothetical protein
MKRSEFYSLASSPKNKNRFGNFFSLDSKLERKFKILQSDRRIPPNAQIYLSHPGLNFRRRKDRLIGLFLVKEFSFCRWLLEEELENSLRFEQNPFERSSFEASLLEETVYEHYFFSKFSLRDFNGNFLPHVEKILGFFSLTIREQPRARKKIRRRGYPTNQHRSLRISLTDLEAGRDLSKVFPDSEAQRQVENCRLCRQLLRLSIIVDYKELDSEEIWV